MTREQQVTTKTLERAEHDWLVSFKWKLEGKSYIHPKIHNSLVQVPGRVPERVRPYSLRDAVAETRAKPWLGWPGP
jgi:hypothetical protein